LSTLDIAKWPASLPGRSTPDIEPRYALRKSLCGFHLQVWTVGRHMLPLPEIKTIIHLLSNNTWKKIPASDSWNKPSVT